MRAINHALTGAVIGLGVGEPVAAMSAAFFSHFALDAIPHFGLRKNDLGGKEFSDLLVLDAILCFGLIVLLFLLRPKHWLLATCCAFLATSPDFMWVGRYLRARAGRKSRPLKNVILQFHHTIQWFERPIGLIVELAWAPAMVLLLVSLVR